MNSINWPAPNIWVFIAQLVEHCSANAEAMGSNPVEAPNFFFGLVKMNSINWPAPNIWVFIAQLVEHCSANAEAMGSNPVEAPNFFFRA